MAKVAEKVPSWVARILLPELRAIVKEEVAAEVKRVEEKMSGEITALRTDIKRIEDTLSTKVDSLGKMLDLVKQVAVLEAKVKELEAKQAQKS
jgi:BMFP domain-containing protein YqiC